MRTFRSRSYIGIDPSIRRTGIAIINCPPDEPFIRKTRLLKPPTEEDESVRLQYLRAKAEEFINEFGNLPLIGSAIEGPSLYSVNQADKLGEVRGVLRVLLADLGDFPPTEVPPTSLKKFATGNGGAKKEKMIVTAKKLWGTLSEDEADAAWLAELALALDEPFQRIVPLTRKQLEAIQGIREMSQPKPKPPAGGRELNI